MRRRGRDVRSGRLPVTPPHKGLSPCTNYTYHSPLEGESRKGSSLFSVGGEAPGACTVEGPLPRPVFVGLLALLRRVADRVAVGLGVVLAFLRWGRRFWGQDHSRFGAGHDVVGLFGG